MQSRSQQSSICPSCGGVLEETPGGALGCMFRLLQAGIGSGDLAQDLMASDDARFGFYEIQHHADGSLYELARGAMGVTYRAADTTLQRKGALKIIKIDCR